MAYLPLHNFKYDSGPRRIQSGPDHEGYIVVTSGVNAVGADNGIVVAGTPLSGTEGLNQHWGYDANWRYVPATARSQVYAEDPTDPTSFALSGFLSARNSTRISSRQTIAGIQAASALSTPYGAINPRQAALQSDSNVVRPERYVYFGGAAPDNQDYSPYNTPEFNTLAEGITGGGVTRRTYENSILINQLGSQGTAKRSEWQYSQPVYCATYTATMRSSKPGLLSSPTRYIYRDRSTSYSSNYGYLFPGEEFSCPYPVGCPETDGFIDFVTPGDTLSAYPPCEYINIYWYNTGSSTPIGEGKEYQVQNSDIGFKLFFTVIYPDGSTDSSSVDCLPPVSGIFGTKFFYLYNRNGGGTDARRNILFYPAYDYLTNFYLISWWDGGAGGGAIPDPHKPVISKVNENKQLVWTYDYTTSSKVFSNETSVSALCFVDDELHCFNVYPDGANLTLVYLERLILDASTGNIKSVDGISYTGYSPPSSLGNYGVIQVVTDELGTYWLLAAVPKGYTAGGIGTISTGVVFCLRTAPDGSLETVWTYELIQQYTGTGGSNPSRNTGVASDGFRLNLDQNILYLQGNYQASFSRPYLFILNASTGNLIYRSTFDGVNGDATVLGFRSCYIDENYNLYQVANVSIGVSRIDNGIPLWISKKDPNGNVIWMNDYDQSIPGDITTNNLALLVRDGVLIFACQLIVGSLYPDSPPVLLLIDPETGTLQRVIRIYYPATGSYGSGDFGTKISLLEAYDPEEFILFTSQSFCMTFNVHNIPQNVTFSGASASQSYTFVDLPVVAPSGYGSYQTNINSNSAPYRVWGGSGVYYQSSLSEASKAAPVSPTYVSGVYIGPI